MISSAEWRQHSAEHARLRESISKFAEVKAEELAYARRRHKAKLAGTLTPIQRTPNNNNDDTQAGGASSEVGGENVTAAAASPRPQRQQQRQPKPIPRYLQDYRLGYKPNKQATPQQPPASTR